jgi:TonB family protein
MRMTIAVAAAVVAALLVWIVSAVGRQPNVQSSTLPPPPSQEVSKSHPLPRPAVPVRLGRTVSGHLIGQPAKVKHVPPVYPAIAQSARIHGVVIIEVVIGPNGLVQDARVLRSIPLLDQAALDAVNEWEFAPTFVNGTAVPLIMAVTVEFTLTDEGRRRQRDE